MLNLNQIAAGQKGGAGCKTGNDLPTQKVVVVPQSTVRDCQNTSEISPAKQVVSLTPKNLIADVCGILEVSVNNTSCAGGNAIIWVGGPLRISNFTELATATTYNQPTGFRTPAFTAIVVDSNVTPTLGGTLNGDGAGFLLLNEFVDSNSIIVSKITFENVNISTAVGSAQSAVVAKLFSVDYSSTLEEEYGAKIFSQQDLVSGGNLQNLTWSFSDACGDGPGVPLTNQTGFEFTIVAGFSGTMQICIAAVETNKDYNEGC